MKLHPEAVAAVVVGFAEFVEKIDLAKYKDTLTPNRGRLIIKQFEDKPEENVQGGIVIPGEVGDKQEVGVIVAAGKFEVSPYSGREIEHDYRVGDVVIIPEHFGHNFVFGPDREKLLSVPYIDVIAKL